MNDKEKNIPVQIAIRKEDKYLMKQIIAKRISEDPENNYSIAGLCKKIISKYLKEYQDEANS